MAQIEMGNLYASYIKVNKKKVRCETASRAGVIIKVKLRDQQAFWSGGELKRGTPNSDWDTSGVLIWG
jgi:hypothetical protein